jgi:hypothetical protein
MYMQEMRYMWNGFKKQYNKAYGQAEEYRFRVFMDNLKLIDERNLANVEAGGDDVHGMTIFSDLTPEVWLPHSSPCASSRMSRCARYGNSSRSCTFMFGDLC